MRGRWDLKDEEWAAVEPVWRPARRENNRGRPWHETRSVLNGVFWVLGSGAHWRELPERYPPYQSCHRRFQQWVRSGKLAEALRLLAAHLHERGRLNLDEAFVDATFASAKKGGLLSARPGVARAPKSSLSPLGMVYLSPYLLKVLHRRNAASSKGCSAEASSTNFRPGLSGTKHMTRTRSTSNSPPSTASS